MGNRVLILLAILSGPSAWGQDVAVSSTTLVQMWTREIPGFDKRTYSPATEFLAIDATNLANDALSLHLFGWGRLDLGDRSNLTGKSGGDLGYGYLRYVFPRANAEIKAGRLTVLSGSGVEQVDGVSLRADLRGGLTLSAFGGQPVWYKTVDPKNQSDYEFQRDIILGTRLGLRIPRIGEVGVSYLQDGSTAARDLPIPSTTDYSRKQLGLDLQLAPTPRFGFNGRTLFDLARHPDPLPGSDRPSRIAEHDYSASLALPGAWTLRGTYTQRNFFAYFAGTNLPSLFRQDERDKFRAAGGSLTWGSASSLQAVVDFRQTHRESYGDARRLGGEVRWMPKGTKALTGLSFHRVSAEDVRFVDPARPAYGLSHSELRGWVMMASGKLSCSLDGILHAFDDKANPHLDGLASVYEAVGSLGWQVTPELKLSGDLAFGSSPLARHETRGLLRMEYRFGAAGKRGGK